MKILEIKNLTKTYRVKSESVYALQDVSFSIYAGEFLMIMGPSGSGKSTLLNILANLDKDASGEVFYLSDNILKISKRKQSLYRRYVTGMVFQMFNLIETATVKYNIQLPHLLSQLKNTTVSFESSTLMYDLNIQEISSMHAENVSTGEQQRVAIARALIKDSEIIFVDEPTGNLDSKSANIVLEIIKKINIEQKKTVVFVTHDETLQKYADRILYIKDGKIERIEVINDKSGEEGIRPPTLAVLKRDVKKASIIKKLSLSYQIVEKNIKRYISISIALAIGFSILIAIILLIGVYSYNDTSFFSPPAFYTTILVNQDKSDLPLTESSSEQIATIPNVTNVTGMKSFSGSLAFDNATIPIYTKTTVKVKNYDLYLEDVAEGRFFKSDNEHSIILSLDVLHLLHTTPSEIIGKNISLNIAPSYLSGKNAFRTLQLTVVGVLYKNLQSQTVLVPNNFYTQEGFGTGQNEIFDGLQVSTASTNSVTSISKAIEGFGYEAIDLKDQLNPLNNVTNSLISFFFILGGVGFINLIITLINVFIILFNEDAREIAIMKTLGARSSDIVTSYIINSIGIGVVVGTLTCILTYIFSLVANSIITLPSVESITVIAHKTIQYGLSTIVTTFIFSILFGVFINFYPAVRGSTLNILKTLKRN